MKNITIALEDKEHDKLVRYKQENNMTWRDMILRYIEELDINEEGD